MVKAVKTTYRVVSNPASFSRGELTVLFAGESQTGRSHRVGPKVVDYYLLHHVMSGRGTFRAGDYEGRLGAGDSFLIRPAQLFQYVADEDDPWRYRWVAFAGTGTEALLAEAGLAPEREPVVRRSGNRGAVEGGLAPERESVVRRDGNRGTVEAGLAAEREPIARKGGNRGALGRTGRGPAEHCKAVYDTFLSRGAAASLEAAGHLHLLLASLRSDAHSADIAPLRTGSHNEELVRQVIGYLSTQYAEPVTIEGMAETLGYNRAYLSRIFRQLTNVTPISFLARLRIDQSRRLLRERTELTIEQIASSVGFHDALYFSKQFHRFCGESPTSYRRAVTRQ